LPNFGQETVPQEEDFYQIIYGSEVSSVPIQITKKFQNLKSNSQYEFKYYCLNQMNLVSTPKTVQFWTPKNGGDFMKL